MFKKRILAAILALTLVVASLSVLNGIIDFNALAESKNYVVNGGFEDGLTGWAGASMPAYSSTLEKSEGEKSMAFTTGNVKVWQYVKVDPSKTYIVAFDLKATSGNNNDNYTFASIDACNDQHAKYIAGKAIDGWTPSNTAVSPTSWTTITNEISTTADQDMICVYFASSSEGAKPTKWFDNVVVMEKSEYLASQVKKGVIVNGSFEDGPSVGWKTKWMSAVTTYAKDGVKSIEFDCANAYTFQYVPVERNTEYTFSYWYVNKGAADAKATSWVSLDFCTADNEKYIANTFIDKYTPQDGYGAYATEWTKMTYTLNSGDNDFLCITVRSNVESWQSGVKKYYDNFVLSKSGEEPGGSGGTEPEKPETPEDEDFEAKLVNPSFETGLEGWKNTGAVANIVEGGSNVTDGNKALMIDKGLTRVFQYIKVKKDTVYKLTFDYKNPAGGGWGWVALSPSKEEKATPTDTVTIAEPMNVAGDWEEISGQVPQVLRKK